jgi:hypothetical protein
LDSWRRGKDGQQRRCGGGDGGFEAWVSSLVEVAASILWKSGQQFELMISCAFVIDLR